VPVEAVVEPVVGELVVGELVEPSKRPAVADSGAFDRRLVSLPNHRHRSNTSAYFEDHFPFPVLPENIYT
jgi:hypothetical protein